MNITVWNENFDETNGVKEVLAVHPNGIHNTLKDVISELPNVNVRTATLQEEHCGLPDEILNSTDVLVWWSHKAHDAVPDELVDRIQKRVLGGMGLILLHSSHYSKLIKRLLGTTGDLSWRDDVYERIFCVNPAHPIARGVPEVFELGIDECYSEPFDIPAPDELVFLSWFASGNVFRSGCTWTRGNGKIFYFQPGHETNQSYFHPEIRKIIKNACEWAAPIRIKKEFGAPHIDVTLEEKRLGKS